MSFNLEILGEKLSKYRNQFQMSLTEVAISTGISENALTEIERGVRRPTGDEVLILADCYKCDYKFFISNEKTASFEQTETLFRKFGNNFSKQDRWAIQECLFLAECEAYVESALAKKQYRPFQFSKVGKHFKTHGKQAAESLRTHLNYSENEFSKNIYEDMRKIGIRVFRKKLENSNISGVYIKHPVAGQCVLINYSEDIYRQRFTAAHETAHAILDEEDIVVSFTKWDKSDLQEIRANSFASAYLMPIAALSKIPSPNLWTSDKAVEWANKFKVSTHALAVSLLGGNLITDDVCSEIKKVKVPSEDKEDPELPADMSPKLKNRKRLLLEKGLSDHYVRLCFNAYQNDVVSASRIKEMLLLESDMQLIELSKMYGETLRYAS